MIKFTVGDILRADVEALVNTVNCVGVMGRGIALQFKNAFPRNFEAYRQACERGEVQPGRMLVFETGTMTNPKFIINFPTKRHWKGKSRIEDIETGLEALNREIIQYKIKSVAIPPLGAGLGGLEWATVRALIENSISAIPDVDVVVYEPNGAPDAKVMSRSIAVPKMTAGRAALVVLIQRYLSGLLDPFVTLLELHKLMYFMQAAGQQLRLDFVKAKYGPYSENLRHVLRAVEGHLVSGYADGGDAPNKQIELVPGAVEEAMRFVSEDHATMQKFERVAALVRGFETPFGLELLASVHWLVEREKHTTTEDVLQNLYSWNDRKKRFSPRQVALAFEALKAQAWI